MKLRIWQFRMRDASLDEAEAYLKSFGQKAAVHAREQLACSLARVLVSDIDAVALGIKDHAPGLDAIWEDLSQEMAKTAADVSEDNVIDDRIIFDIYPLRGDVLIQNALDRFRCSDLWYKEPRIEKYGKVVLPYDQAEYDRRAADWGNVQTGRRVVAFDGVVERPAFEDIRAKLPDASTRAHSLAAREIEKRELDRVAPDTSFEDFASAMIMIEEFLSHPEGAAEIEKVRLEMLEKLPPKITDDMLIDGIGATPRRLS